MEQPEHRKNAGEITALVLFFNYNYTVFLGNKMMSLLIKEFSVFSIAGKNRQPSNRSH